MRFYTELRAGMQEVFDTFFVPLTITRITITQPSLADKAAGKTGTRSTVTIPANGVFGVRTIKLTDGSTRQQAIVSCDRAIRIGDKIIIGNRSAEAVEIIDNSPDGETEFAYKAVVK